MLEYGLLELLLFPGTPVLALLDVEVLDVELAILVANVSTAQVLAHLDAVLLLGGRHGVIARLPLLLLDEHRGGLRALL